MNDQHGVESVLFVGDPHFRLDNVVQCDKYAEECLRVFRDQVRSVPASVAIIAGDVLDGHGVIQMQCLNKAVSFLTHMADVGDTYVLVGNHDYYNNNQYLTSNHWMMCIKNKLCRYKLVVVDRPTMVDRVIMCPYVPPGMLVKALEEEFGDAWVEARAVFAHQEISGAKLSEHTTSERGDSWLSEYPQLISGHIHARQKPLTNVWYPGSVIQHCFGDVGDSRVTVININDTQYSYRDVPISVPTKRYVDVVSDDILNGVFTDTHVRELLAQNSLLSIKIRLRLTVIDHKKHPKLLKFIKNLPACVGLKYIVVKKEIVDVVSVSDDEDERGDSFSASNNVSNLFISLVRVAAHTHTNRMVSVLHDQLLSCDTLAQHETTTA